MRRVIESRPYRKDLKRAGRGVYRYVLDDELPDVIGMLANDIPLTPKNRDHPLHGMYEGFRECHVKPDFLLMYRLEGDDVLRLERLGSHAELFGI